jgi:squalene-associated FAD-dependent desaturase
MRRRVAVVGGGLAGIAAALDLADAGAEVTLLEVRPRLGGAAYSTEREGLVVDNGQHVFLRCCTAYRALLARIGAAGDAPLQERLDIPVLAPGRRPARLWRTALPAPAHLAPALLRYAPVPLRERPGVARAMLALRRVDPDDPAAEARSFGSWLAEHRQGAAAVEAIWRLIALPTLNLEPREASLAQAAQVFRTGLLTDAPAADIGWARVPLSGLHDAPARRALAAAGVAVELRRRVERIVPAGGGWAVQGPAGTVEADAVVVAVPPARAARVLPPQARGGLPAVERLGRSPIVNLLVHYDRAVLDHEIAAAIGSPVQWLFDRTRSSGATHGQVVAVSLSAADEEAGLDADALRARFEPALAGLLPRARGARVERFLVTREHAATFRAAPGARALRPRPRTAAPGIVLAGAWTDTGWPATMEGAVRSGHAAAGAALAARRMAAAEVAA